ncbi:MAG: DEAD/DEAH box helicase [Bacteroidales bacterium]|jgi:ATP-dependent RNA helicase DeaD|nr:DEAD/DEAH box helicase [Bacteroidales bacterium]
MTFQETGLHEDIVRATDELGFEQPTPIQERIIPLVLETEKDIIALAQTGTGKTAAFGLPLIHLADMDFKGVQAIVLCPTRELCMQITGDMEKFSKYIRGFKTVAVYGGADIRNQMKALKSGCQVVVGTPGRVMDLINREVLKLSHIKWLVLDEADEMLNMGFKEDLDIILADTPKEKRTLLFSATMPGEIASIARKYMDNPEEVSVGNRNQGADNVRHEFYTVHAKDRYSALKRIADIYPNIYGIVFCRTRAITKEVADKLMNDGYNADALHGDLSQAQRDFVMNRFRIKQLQLLVATDVAARGLDVNDLTHIINYDLPDDNEVYIHRTGRTARAGKSGIAISIIHSRETKKIRDIEHMLNKRFEQKKVPTGVEICEKQLFNLVDRVEKVEVDEAQIEQFLPVILKKLEWLSREDLIKHFVSEEFNRILAYYKNTPDLNVAHPEDDRKRSRKGQGQFVTLQINAGFHDGLNPPRLIGLVNEQTRSRDIDVGRIEIGPNSSFFEIEKNSSEEVLKSFKDAIFEGVKVKVGISAGELKPRSKSRSNDRSKYQSGDRPKYRSDDRPKYKSDERPKFKSDGRPRHKSDDQPGDKPKAWENDLSKDWKKDKTKGKSTAWLKDKPKGKSNSRSNDRPQESFGGKKRKRSPYKNW